MTADGDSPLTVEQQVSLMRTLSARELKAKYRQVFGEVPRTHNKRYLIRRIAWRLQALAEGGLSQRARQRAALLAVDSQLRLCPPRGSTAEEPQNSAPAPQDPAPPAQDPAPPVQDPAPPPPTTRTNLPLPGTVLSRPYRGRTIEVKVLANGFECDGQVYASLSALAKAITGTHWSGPRFFGLSAPPDAVKRARPANHGADRPRPENGEHAADGDDVHANGPQETKHA